MLLRFPFVARQYAAYTGITTARASCQRIQRHHASTLSRSPDASTPSAADLSASQKAAATLLKQVSMPGSAPSSASPSASASPQVEEQQREQRYGAAFSGSRDDIPLDTPEQVEQAFKASVEARTVGNAQLRRFIHQLPTNEHALALAAVKGAVLSGLKPNAATYEALMDKLLHAGQLKASMEIYNEMLRNRLVPTPTVYALLMEMCLERDMQDSCQRLFNDMQKRGAQPSPRNYELMITSLASEVPPKWEMAVQVFDKISKQKGHHVTAATYNALMRVYLNMEPFDWRVVYNCYQELRNHEPHIPLQWESYYLLREALIRGNAGRVRRVFAFMDAWTTLTPLRSANFAVGALFYLVIVFIIKTIISYFGMAYYDKLRGATSDSVLPTL